MKINTQIVLKSLAGVELTDSEGKDLKVGKLLALILNDSRSDKLKSFKIYDLCRRLFNDDSVELDKPDLEAVKLIVDEDKTHTNLIKGQIIEILNNIKE